MRFPAYGCFLFAPLPFIPAVKINQLLEFWFKKVAGAPFKKAVAASPIRETTKNIELLQCPDDSPLVTEIVFRVWRF